MLILEIAAGVVLGGLALELLRTREGHALIGGAILIAGCLMLIGALVGAVAWAFHFEVVQTAAISVAALASLCLGPLVAGEIIRRKWPGLFQFVERELSKPDGESARNLGIKALAAIVIAGLAVGGAIAVLMAVSYLFPKFH